MVRESEPRDERTRSFLAQLQSLIASYDSFCQRRQSPVDLVSFADLWTRAHTVIDRVAGPNSVYARQAEQVAIYSSGPMDNLGPVMGVVKALANDLSPDTCRRYPISSMATSGETFFRWLNISWERTTRMLPQLSLEAH
jgi:hypothetical protein